jgi:hypothetical protein
MHHRRGGHSNRPVAEWAGAEQRVEYPPAGGQRAEPLFQAHRVEHSPAGGAGASHAGRLTCTTATAAAASRVA